jgi:hypothetical protein
MIKDKITQAIAEAAMTIISETWPDAASTSIYVDKAGTTPISDVETPASHTKTDEATTLKVGSRVKVVSGSGLDSGKEGVIVDRSNVKTDGRGVPMNLSGNYKPIDWSKEVLIKQDDGKMFSMFKNRVVPIEESIEISEEEITEALKASQPASEWIHDFVNSDDSKFKGKSKAERINMALGAYYAAQRSVKEGVEEPRAEGEKRFKAAHVINKVHDVNQDKQTGTESMDSKSKPALPMGTSPTKPEHYDEMEQVEQDVKDIKSSISKQAKAPEAKGTKQAGAESAESLKDTTKGGTQNAAAPKATGSKQSGTESAEKVKDTAPSGKLNAEAPKATGTTHKGAESMPKGLTGPGLKESAIAILLGEDAVNASKHVKHAKATKPVADKIKKVLSKGTSKYHETVKEETLTECEMSDFDKRYAKDHEKELKQILSGQGTDGIDSRLQPELQKFITSYGDGLKKYLGIQVEEDSKGWDGTAEVSAKHAENTNGAVKESAEVETDQGDTTVPQNALVDALKDLAEVIERCEGVVPRNADFKNTHLFMKVQKAQALLADVCMELENIEG